MTAEGLRTRPSAPDTNGHRYRSFGMRCPAERNPAEGGAWVRGRPRPQVSAGRDVTGEPRSSCPACRDARAGTPAAVPRDRRRPRRHLLLRCAMLMSTRAPSLPRRMSCRRSIRFLRRRLRTRGCGRRRRPPDVAFLTGVPGNARGPGFSLRRSSPRWRVRFFCHVLLPCFSGRRRGMNSTIGARHQGSSIPTIRRASPGTVTPPKAGLGCAGIPARAAR